MGDIWTPPPRNGRTFAPRRSQDFQDYLREFKRRGAERERDLLRVGGFMYCARVVVPRDFISLLRPVTAAHCVQLALQRLSEDRRRGLGAPLVWNVGPKGSREFLWVLLALCLKTWKDTREHKGVALRGFLTDQELAAYAGRQFSINNYGSRSRLKEAEILQTFFGRDLELEPRHIIRHRANPNYLYWLADTVEVHLQDEHGQEIRLDELTWPDVPSLEVVAVQEYQEALAKEFLTNVYGSNSETTALQAIETCLAPNSEVANVGRAGKKHVGREGIWRVAELFVHSLPCREWSEPECYWNKQGKLAVLWSDVREHVGGFGPDRLKGRLVRGGGASIMEFNESGLLARGSEISGTGDVLLHGLGVRDDEMHMIPSPFRFGWPPQPDSIAIA